MTALGYALILDGTRRPLGVGHETIDKRMIGADPVEPNRLAYGGYLVLGGQQVKVACWIVPNT